MNPLLWGNLKMACPCQGVCNASNQDIWLISSPLQSERRKPCSQLFCSTPPECRSVVATLLYAWSRTIVSQVPSKKSAWSQGPHHALKSSFGAPNLKRLPLGWPWGREGANLKTSSGGPHLKTSFEASNLKAFWKFFVCVTLVPGRAAGIASTQSTRWVRIPLVQSVVLGAML